MTDFQRELDVNYCHLAVISTDPPEVCGALRAGLGATFAFLSDHERRAVIALDIPDETDRAHPRIAIPTASRWGQISPSARSTTVAGSSAATPSKSYARTCAQ